jgi:hypothetical protein
MLAQQLGAEIHMNRGKGMELKFKFIDSRKKDQATAGTSRQGQTASAKVGGG